MISMGIPFSSEVNLHAEREKDKNGFAPLPHLCYGQKGTRKGTSMDIDTLDTLSPDRLHELASDLVEQLATEHKGSRAWLIMDSGLRSFVPAGLYEHHKSTPEERKFYVVIGVSEDTEGGGYVVSYFATYEPFKGRLAHRRLLGEGGFLTPVERGDNFVHRFKRTSSFIERHVINDSLAQVGMLVA
jgi:hypothetical protein